MKYPLTSIKSGDDEVAGMWVSLHYRSKDGEQYALHIVAGEKSSVQTVGRTLVPIYFEHDDQSLSCYAAADKISVARNTITLTLNKNGRDSLELPGTAEFVAETPGADFESARIMFTEMKKRHGGNVIHLA